MLLRGVVLFENRQSFHGAPEFGPLRHHLCARGRGKLVRSLLGLALHVRSHFGEMTQDLVEVLFQQHVQVAVRASLDRRRALGRQQQTDFACAPHHMHVHAHVHCMVEKGTRKRQEEEERGMMIANGVDVPARSSNVH